MEKAFATYLNGTVLLDQAVDWPNGTRVELTPSVDASVARNEIERLRRAWENEESIGLDESLWPTTQEGLDFLVAHMDAAEPLQLTPEEIELIEQEREADKKLQKELMRKSWKELENLF